MLICQKDIGALSYKFIILLQFAKRGGKILLTLIAVDKYAGFTVELNSENFLYSAVSFPDQIRCHTGTKSNFVQNR